MPRQTLDSLVTQVASELMGVDATTMVSASERVLASLVEHFDVDVSYLRHTDRAKRATVLVAEWPRRPDVPDPDPLHTVEFEHADSVFRALEFATEPLIVRPGADSDDYQETIRKSSGIPEVAMACVPLVSRGESTGVLGFVKMGDRAWSKRELNVLKAIAALFAQLQARVVAEEKLRYIALHDDLTGLANRRALLEYMEERLRAGEAGPVATFFLDLDRLKALNDFLGHSAGDNFIRTLARRLKQNLEPGDMIARLGGDEFVIVPAAPMDAVAAELEATRIQQLIGRRVSVGQESVSRGVSVGVALGIPGETSVSDVPAAPITPCCRRSPAAATASRCSPTPCARSSNSRTTSSSTCAARCPTARWCCTTSPRSTCAPAGSWPWKRWSAGSTPPAGCCRPAPSSRWPRPPTWPVSSAAG